MQEMTNTEHKKWQKMILTYRIDRYPYNEILRRSQIDSEIAKAFDLWKSPSSPFAFTHLPNRGHGDPDISISFATEDHNDDYPFDGPGKTLAHAYPPGHGIGGDIHFDEDENWTIASTQGVNLFTVAAHELGHSLGLNHSSVYGSLMFPWYEGFDPELKLHQDDIDSIRFLYDGTAKKQAPPSDGDADDYYHSCSTKLDTLTAIRGEIFLFQDKWFWRRDRNWRLNVKPSTISSFWMKFPPELDSVDAVYERPQDNRIVFFKGKQFFEFDGLHRVTKSGRPLTDLGLPNDVTNIDVIFAHGGRTYVISGRRHWTIDEVERRATERSYEADSPFLINSSRNGQQRNFLTLPISAAFTHPNGDVYVLKGSHYWKFGGREMMVMKSPENGQPTQSLWSDCPTATSSSSSSSSSLSIMNLFLVILITSLIHCLQPETSLHHLHSVTGS